MLRLVRVSVIAGAMALAGCSTSWMPSWDLGSIGSTFSGGANVSLTIESDPPGADARTSVGPSCRTPCMVPVPGDREFTVTYTLNGYLPRTVPVAPRPTEMTRTDSAIGGAALAELTPNPVYAQLDPAPPPAPVKRRPVKKKPAAPKPAPPAPPAK